MPSPNAVFTELVTTTWRKHAKDLKDNLSKNNALLRRLDKKGMKRKEDGGLTIVQGLDYAANQTYQRYSGYDVLNVGASDVLTAAEYQWRQIAINVVASGLDLRINNGGNKIVNLAKARIKNAIRTAKNNFSVDLYSDGTLANQINGLQALVSDTDAADGSRCGLDLVLPESPGRGVDAANSAGAGVGDEGLEAVDLVGQGTVGVQVDREVVLRGRFRPRSPHQQRRE